MQWTAYSIDGGATPVEQKTNDAGLIGAIVAYRASMADFDRNASDVPEEADDLAQRTYMPKLDVLVEWQKPATSREEAIAALRLALSESPVSVIGGTFVQPMMQAVLSYLENGDMSPGMSRIVALMDKINTNIAAKRVAADAYALENDPDNSTELDDAWSDALSASHRAFKALVDTPCFTIGDVRAKVACMRRSPAICGGELEQNKEVLALLRSLMAEAY